MRGLGMGLGMSAGGLSRGFAPSPGLITLPPWLAFSCPSVRTVQISANAVLRNVQPNQAVCFSDGINTGILHEPASINYASYSEAFGSWLLAGSPGLTFGIVDPAGGTTGITVSTPGPFGYNISSSTTAPGMTAMTVSSWVEPSTTPNTAIFGLLDNSVTLIPNPVILNPVAKSGWNRYSGTYLGTSRTMFYMDIGDQRMVSPSNTPSNASYAFYQAEGLPYATSYIPNAGTANTTRLASVLTFSLSNNTYFTLNYTATMAVGSTSGFNQHIVRSQNAACYCYINGTGYLVSTAGNTLTDTTPLVFSAGDKLTFTLTYNSTTSYTVAISKNGTPYYTKTFTHSGVPTFQYSGNYLASDNAGNVMMQLGITNLYLH